MARRKLTLEKALPYILIVAGIIGLLAAFTLTLDKMRTLESAGYRPGCDLNPILSCGSVMKSAQGSAFGFPNPWLGLPGFAVLVTIGMSLLAGAKFKRWFWLGLQTGLVLGVGFVHWLIYESIYTIHSLCPWCMGVWVITIATFWYVTVYNLRTGVIKLPKTKFWQATRSFIDAHHLDILVLWYLVILGLILNHFWYYFGKHLF